MEKCEWSLADVADQAHLGSIQVLCISYHGLRTLLQNTLTSICLLTRHEEMMKLSVECAVFFFFAFQQLCLRIIVRSMFACANL